MRGATRIDILVWAGWLLLLAGLAVVGIQAMSGIAFEWCIGLKACGMQVEPKMYRDVYGLVLVGMGGAGLVAAAVIDAVAVHLAARPPGPTPES
jgi:hypothetical protein